MRQTRVWKKVSESMEKGSTRSSSYMRVSSTRIVDFAYQTGQFGVKKTSMMLRSHFYWPKMRSMAEGHCARCLTCKKAKSRVQPYGLYMALPIPTSPWVDLSMYFLVGLLVIDHRDSVMVVIERFSQMAHFIPCSKTWDATMTAKLFFREIERLHVVPKTIVSDRDSKFLVHFWRTLWKGLDNKLLYSTASHPQTDGQMEVTNRSLASLLRAAIGNNRSTWLQCIP